MNPDDIPDSTVPSTGQMIGTGSVPKQTVSRQIFPHSDSATPSSSTTSQNFKYFSNPRTLFRQLHPSSPQSTVSDSSAMGYGSSSLPSQFSLRGLSHLVAGIDTTNPKDTFQMPESPSIPVRHFLRPSMCSTTSYPRNTNFKAPPKDIGMKVRMHDTTTEFISPAQEYFDGVRNSVDNHSGNNSGNSSNSSSPIKNYLKQIQQLTTVVVDNSSSNENSEASFSSILSDNVVGTTAEIPGVVGSTNSSNNSSVNSPITTDGALKISKPRGKKVQTSNVDDSIKKVIAYTDEDANMSLIEPDEESSSSFSNSRNDSNSQFNDISETHSDSDGARRTQRKRKPTKHFMQDMIVPLKLKMRKKQADIEFKANQRNFSFETMENEKKNESTCADSSTLPVVDSSGRGRGRGTGRGRGRPRGSKNKVDKGKKKTPMKESPEEIKMSPEIKSETQSPNEEITQVESSTNVISQVTPRKPRGRGGTRGTRARGARGGVSRKTPTPKKKTPKQQPPVDKKPVLLVFEEETRMSADIKPIIPEKPIVATPSQDDESTQSQASTQSASSTSAATKAKKFIKDLVVDRKLATAETLFEYVWPQDETNTESYMLQEQISEYLGVTSFKRKYPDITRRVVDIEERDFLRAHKIVTETQCDLGLTALCSSDVKDIMCNDFPDKYEEYLRVVALKREREVKAKPNTSTSPIVRDRSAEFMRRVIKNCAKWNKNMNKERKDDRSSSFDLQTNTLNYPKGKHLILPAEATAIGYYPVAVLPGHYTDNYQKYTSDELKYVPLNTVLYGPVLPQKSDKNESDDSGTDSCISTSSSDDASSTTSRSDIEMIPDEIAFPLGRTIVTDKLTVLSTNSNPMCKSCEGNALKNKDGVEEVLIHCTKCDVPNHPTCLELTLDMLPFIKKYNWQCTDCKNCIECNDPADEDKMLFCDLCDRGYHIYCVGLRKVPTGRWHCSVCSVCHSCGARDPSSIGDRSAEWHHEFKKGDKGIKFYLHSLCNSCHKLYKKGLYCPGCLKCHVDPDANLLECRKCEKWVHKACVKNRPLQSMFGFMCDPCDAEFRSRTKLPSHVN